MQDVPDAKLKWASLEKNFRATNLCASAMLVCFFLPWLNFLGANPSGFDVQKQGGEAWLLWLMPAACLFTVFAGMKGWNQKLSASMCGLLPFIFLAYGIAREGETLISVLNSGAYLSLLFGAVLVVAGRGAK